MADSIDIDPRNPVAEFVGTFALIFIGAGSVIATGGTNLVGIAIAHGLAFALLSSALGHFSGGYFNPALTIGLWVTQQLDTLSTIAYIIAQLVGAVVAALALLLLFPDGLVESDVTQLGTPILNRGLSFAQGVGIEAILTVFIMLVLLGTAVGARRSAVGGFGVGLAVTMGMLAAQPLTGAAMNPARAFGPALVDGTWDSHVVYWIGPIVGAVLAALLYQYLFAAGVAASPLPATETSNAPGLADESALEDAFADETIDADTAIDEAVVDATAVDEVAIQPDESAADEDRYERDQEDPLDETSDDPVDERSGDEEQAEEESASP